MEKATKIISKVVAIAMIVLSALALAYTVVAIIEGAGFGELIVFILIFAAMLATGILLLGAIKDLASVKYLVLISVAAVLMLLYKVLYAGIVLPMYSAAIFGLISETLAEIFFYVFSYGAIALIIAAVVAIVLNVVQRVKK